MAHQLPIRLSKADRKKMAAQLRDMFPHVPSQLVTRIVGDCGSFEEGLERVLAIAPKHEPAAGPPPQDQLQSVFPETSAADVHECLKLSEGSVELAVDLLSSMQHEARQLERSVDDLCSAFPGLQRSHVATRLAANRNDFEAAALELLAASSGGLSRSEGQSQREADVAFLKAMFRREGEEVLEGLLEDMGSLEHVVDFLLSLDVLLMEEAVIVAHGGDKTEPESAARSEEEMQLAELFPSRAMDELTAALEACEWDVNEAVAVLTDGGGESVGKSVKKKTSRRWEKLEAKHVLSGARVGPSQRWNGSNANVREGISELQYEAAERAKRQATPSPPPPAAAAPLTNRPPLPVAHVAPGSQYEEHIFSHARYAGPSITAADLQNKSTPSKMAQMHQENRRRYSFLATNAYKAGDGQAAKQFSKLAEQEERLFGSWSAMATGKQRSIDLHGFFVREAMDICRNVLASCRAGESVTFITGRGNNSEGGVARIRNELVKMLQGMPCCFEIGKSNAGTVIVTMK